MNSGYEDFLTFAEEMLDVADDETGQSLKDQLFGNIDFLKNISNSFLDAAQETWSKIKKLNDAAKHAEKIKRSLKKNHKDIPDQELLDTLELIKSLKIENLEFDLFAQSVFRYQAAVNAVLGQSVELIYVYRDENGSPEIWHIGESGNNITAQSMASKGRGLIAKYKSLSAMDAHKQQLKASISEKDSQGFEVLKKTYNEVGIRADISKEVLGNNAALLVMWYTNDWRIMKVSAMGDINEAYAAFFLNMLYRESFIFPDNGTELNVEYFMTDKTYGVAAVDPVSGLLQGDISVSLNNGHTLEFAVKSAGASALSFEQVINLALAIKNGTHEEITLAWLQDYKEGLTYTNFIKRQRKIQGRNRIQPTAKCLENTANKLLQERIAKERVQIPIPNLQ